MDKLQQLNRHKTLILDQAYQPIGIVSWEKAIYLHLAHKAEALNYHQGVTISSPNQEFELPAVLRVRWLSRRPKKVYFSRTSLLARDNFTCAYCGNQFPAQKLTLDHVVPCSKGGARDWDNIVSACYKCNSRKANRTPEQAGMMLLFKPHEPRWTASFLLQITNSEVLAAWQDYLPDWEELVDV